MNSSLTSREVVAEAVPTEGNWPQPIKFMPKLPGHARVDKVHRALLAAAGSALFVALTHLPGGQSDAQAAPPAVSKPAYDCEIAVGANGVLGTEAQLDVLNKGRKVSHVDPITHALLPMQSERLTTGNILISFIDPDVCQVQGGTPRSHQP